MTCGGVVMIERQSIPDVVLLRPKRYEDERGWFCESFKDGWFRENVADVCFVQDNQSYSKSAGTIRGLHYQSPPFAQGKLIKCLQGSIFDVAVDLRVGSPTFGKWVGVTLTAAAGEQVWVPEGFAHGFRTLVPDVEIFYKVTAPYSAACDQGLAFDDPALAIVWPGGPPEAAALSPKDRAQPVLADIVSPFHYTAPSGRV
jgi:dTDP-4-dehydrorhamnose 3,5-epimerase